jgi:ribonuclease HII
MTAALRLATRRALAQLTPDLAPDAVVLDGTFDFVSPPRAPQLFDADGAVEPDAVGEPVPESSGRAWTPPVETVIGGDARCASVAAASVLAKVTRDRMMRATADSYPAFEFDRNKGYPSPAHQRALCGYGLSAVHRRSWAFVDSLPWELTTWPGDYRARHSRLDGGLLGEPEDALADDVVEDLVGPSGDAHAWESQEEL